MTTETTETTEVLLTRPEASAILKTPVSYLAGLAASKPRRGPRFTKWGTADRSPVRYRLSDVLDWATDPARHEREVWGTTAAKQNARRQKAGR